MRFLVWRCGDRDLAEDILADTFERVMRTRVRFDPRRGSERAWITTIAINLLKDHAKRQAAQQRAVERVTAGPAAGPADPTAAVAERDEIAHALAELSDAEREVVMLRFAADLTLVEIARTIGQPRTTVEARLYRALAKLRDLVDQS